jgi:hypothetical protein
MYEARINELSPLSLSTLVLNNRCPLCIGELNKEWTCKECSYEAEWMVYPCCYVKGVS